MSLKQPVGVIGGTGLTSLEGVQVLERIQASTQWGEPSSALVRGQLGAREVLFLARHGENGSIQPHQVNYRANIQALADQGVQAVIAVAAVGGIAPNFPPGAVAVPDQIIDYSWGRAHTFFDDNSQANQHIDFTWPYTESLRQQALQAAALVGIDVVAGGTYGCTQGPRLETAAEIRKLAADGCTMVGMTGMPEAALARELGLGYAHLAVSVNWGAGLQADDTQDIHAQIEQSIAAGMAKVHHLLRSMLNE